jgi:hypothetical protein
MSAIERHLKSSINPEGIIHWTVEIDTPGFYQLALESDEWDEPIWRLGCSWNLSLDDKKPPFAFQHHCNKFFVHLCSGNHDFFLTTGDRAPRFTDIHWVDVRLAYPNCGGYPQTVLLKSGQSVEQDSIFATSPSKQYCLEFRRKTGDVFLYDGKLRKQEIVWRADWNERTPPQDSSSDDAFYQLCMQGDGNLVMRRICRESSIHKESKLVSKAVWKTVTQGNPGAYLVLNDAGQLLVLDPHTTATSCCSPLYVDGLVLSLQHYEAMRRRCHNDDDHFCLLLPRNGNRRLPPKELQQPPNNPIRGTFYYPWYPTTWTVDSKNHAAHFIPKLGKYDSGHLSVILDHVKQLRYGKFDLAISSWWGQDTKSDRARLLTIMDVSYHLTGGGLKWCIYFEPQKHDDAVVGLKQKLQYLKKWFTRHPSWMHVDNKPVIFVYNLRSDCSTSQKWVQACRDENFYLVLKWFSGWKQCEYQPQSWHQYGPSTQWHHGNGEFVNISPGFWQAREEKPRLERLSKEDWYASVRKMVSARDVKWHLVTSFNEACEGTLIEATEEWDTTKHGSGMGYFLDALHEIK